MKARSMAHIHRVWIVLTITVLLLACSSAYAGMVINAGSPQTVCIGDSVTLGGSPTASGGKAPYTYQWSPSTNMNNPASSNPRAKILTTTMFYLTVIDSTGSRLVDSVLISIGNVYAVNAGHDTSICPFTAGATLGGSSNTAGYTYAWSPSSGLSCTNCPHPKATPAATTTYTLIASSGSCHDSTTVTVTVLPSPVITVTSPVTVNEGSTVTLSASGGVSYYWTGLYIIANANTANPEVEPYSSTTDTVVGIGANGCPGFNTVYIEVIPDSDLIFYNTFSPNGDGINDYWYVGNLGRYPNNSLTIYNRYGKQVYFAQPYNNLWNGSSNGSQLPDATYYFVMSTGTGKTYRGSITIIRKPQ